MHQLTNALGEATKALLKNQASPAQDTEFKNWAQNAWGKIEVAPLAYQDKVVPVIAAAAADLMIASTNLSMSAGGAARGAIW